MNDHVDIDANNNKGSLAGINKGEMSQIILKSEYKQEYYIHSAARISNYFSWVKFIITISSASIAATASTLFAVKETTPCFYILISCSIACFFVSIITGLLSFIGHVKYEESKAVYSYMNYCNQESANTLFRVTVDPWYSKYGNISFFAVATGFLFIISGIVIFWLERFGTSQLWCWIGFIICLIAVIFIMFFLYKKSKKYFFRADDEDCRIEKFESSMEKNIEKSKAKSIS